MSNNPTAAAVAAMNAPQVSALPPNQTLYIKNLNQRIKKEGIHSHHSLREKKKKLNIRSPTRFILSF
jgi:hypothetical protein